MLPLPAAVLAACLALARSYSLGIFDAGSTGTRLNIYTFDDEGIKEVASYRRTGGLHKMPLGMVSGTIDYLIRESQIDRLTPLWFYGTAGIRSLPAAQQTAIMTEAKNVLAGYNLREAGILSATSEGAYMLKAFEYLSPYHPSFMIVDMGGLSVQLIKKDEEGAQVESYELGITKSQCDADRAVLGYLAAAKPCTSCTPCPAGVRESRLMDAFDNDASAQLLGAYCRQSQCIIENFVASSVRRAKTGCFGPTVFLCSYMHDLFGGYGRSLTLKSLGDVFRSSCGTALSRECRQIYYAIMLLERLGFCEGEVLHPLRKIGGFDVTWALGRAVEAREADGRSPDAAGPPASRLTWQGSAK